MMIAKVSKSSAPVAPRLYLIWETYQDGKEGGGAPSGQISEACILRPSRSELQRPVHQIHSDNASLSIGGNGR